MITTVTMNASIDKAYHMDKEIVNGTVMRVATCKNSAGGKGLNVSRVIKLCGQEVLATGLVGGYNGKYLESLLDEDKIPHKFVHVKGETRSCINILDSKYGSTEYLEAGCMIEEEEEKEFLEVFKEIIKDSDVVAISGSVPKGLHKDIYQRMVSMCKDIGKKVLLDTSGEVLKNGIKTLPTLIKPNEDEMAMLLDKKIESIEKVVTAAKELHEKGIEYVVVSLGKEGALLVCDEGVFHAKPPKVEVVNTVGCGDSMVGAFAVAFERNYSSEEALKYAIAVGTANALSPNTGDFDPAVCEKILSQVELKRL